MATETFQAGDILGLTPGIDLRNSEKIFAVGGKNFAFTSLGPKSLFGNRLLTPSPVESPEHIQSVRIRLRSGDRVFVFNGLSILEWDEENSQWLERYTTPSTNISPYRWTAGYLNGLIFFCHPVTGILVMNIETSVITRHQGPGVPTQPLAIVVSNGRLVVLDDTYLSWSWQSDGMNFTPALGEAGAQKVGDRVAGFPIMVSTYGQGVVTWTTGGMMRSEFTGDQEVFRHRNLNTEYRPINSFCTIQMDDNTCVILDERGLFKSTGDKPDALAPMFNEFLIEYIRINKLMIGQNIRLEWDDLRRLFYVSVSVTPEYPQYEKAFVLYPSLDKWGQFNEVHHGILPLLIDWNQRSGNYFGFCDSGGRIHFWGDFPQREVWDSDAAEPVLVGLDSKIQLGLIRFAELPDSFDRMSEIQSVAIGNVISGPEHQFGEDYLTVPDGVDDEDYEQLTGQEDWGFNTLHYVNHRIRVLSTLDGRQMFQSAEPSLVQFAKGIRHFSCSSVGIWHILEIYAEEPGEAYHVRFAALNAADAGRLS